MDQNEKQPQQPPTEWIASPHGIVEIYANLATMQWTLDDVRVRLAQLINDPQRPTPGPVFYAVAEERGAVTFSWRTAKIFRDQLANLIANYEKQNGEIATDIKLATPSGAAAPVTIPKSP
jgi:hypothetical protein